MIDKAKLQQLATSPRTKRYALRTVIAFVALSLFGFFALPPIVKHVMLSQLGEALHRTVSVQEIHINPYALSVEIDGVAVQEREGKETFASFDSLYVNLESASIFRVAPVISQFRLVNPKVHVVRLADGRYNFSDLVDEYLNKPKNDEPMPGFSVNNIQISGGEIAFDDRPVDEKHLVSAINLNLPFVSSLAYATEIFVEPSFSAQINGAPLTIAGRSKPFADSLETEITLDLADLKLAQFVDYSPVKLPIKMASGVLDSELKVVFRQEKDKPSSLDVSGTVGVKDVKIAETAGSPLVSFKKLDVDIASAELLGGKFDVAKVSLESPEIDARASAEGDLNWLLLLDKVNQSLSAKAKNGKAPKPDVPPAAPGNDAAKSNSTQPVAKKPVNTANGKASLAWSVGEAAIHGGVVHWTDESNGAPFSASVEKIDVGVKKLSSRGEKPAIVDLALRLAAGDGLTVDQVAVQNGEIFLNKREIVLGEVAARGVRSLIKRAKDGQLEWLKPPALRASEASASEPASPWKAVLTKVHGEDINLRFEDGAVSPTAVQTIEGLGFDLENVSTEPGQVAKVAMQLKLNKKGEVAFSGNVTPSPLSAELGLDVKSVELLPLQPYFAEKLNVEVTRGLVTVKGDLQVRQDEGKKPGEAGAFSGGFAGQATIGDFQAVDKINSADFLRWKSFFFDKVEAKLGPDSISVGEVALSDFFARVIVSPEGKLNLMQILRRPDSEAVAVVRDAAPSAAQAKPLATAPAKAGSEGKAVAPVAEASKPLMPVKIGKITLQGGTVRFTDNFIKPNYTANLRKIGGSITGLSTEAGSTANLTLRGSYDDVAPLNITAKVNPLSSKPYLDLQADVKGIELTSFSAYSGKYAGYEIDKGKLSLFVKYKIENDQLNAENRIFLDQLTFGDPVASPDATKLPVKLAIALLKNRNGEIDINLPISGTLSDPEFSIGGLVVKVIVNLFVKAVTAPFALIGSLFSGGEEMSIIEFDYGRATITADGQKRLENLAKALVDRPGLNLEIEGHVDAEQDREGLKTARIDRKVRALKREDQTKSGVETGAADSVEVTTEEYPALLERVYRAEKFPKPRNMVGMVKSLPVEEMEKLIVTHTTVDDDDLNDLGDRRAKAVRDWLVDHEISVERVFLRPTVVGEGEVKPGTDAKPKAKSSRVEFILK